MTKVQKAFRYFLDLLNDVYETGWSTSEALADVVVEFNLDELEVQQLQWIHEAFESFGFDFSHQSLLARPSRN